MSRSGYTEDGDDMWSLIRWRGAVNSAIKGKRGQKFLRELRDALDAMPEKKLIKDELQTGSGEVCAIGALGAARGMNMEAIDPEDSEVVSKEFGIAEALAREIVYENDEEWRETPEERWLRMRRWVDDNIVQVAPPDTEKL